MKTKSKTAIIRGRTKKQTNELVSVPVQQQSPSHTYATIERDPSFDRTSLATIDIRSTTTATTSATHVVSSSDTMSATPKQSTFKRIQSLFRPSPSMIHLEILLMKYLFVLSISALTSSARINRVLQTKSTVIAFGSSTPTQRQLPTLSKIATPAPSVSAIPTPSMVKKIPSPKGKYNLRTRLFANPTHTDKDKDEEEVS